LGGPQRLRSCSDRQLFRVTPAAGRRRAHGHGGAARSAAASRARNSTGASRGGARSRSRQRCSRARRHARRCSVNPLAAAIVQLWPYALAFGVAAAVPRRPGKWERFALGLSAVLGVAFVRGLWPGAEAPAEPTPEWPHLLNVIVFLPILGAFAVLFLPRQAPRLLRRFSMAVLLLDFVASLWL